MPDETNKETGGVSPSPDASSQATGAGAKTPKPEPTVIAAPEGPPDPPAPDDVAVPKFLATLQSALPDAVEKVSYWVGDWTAILSLNRLVEVARFLKEHQDAGFDFCSDITASDWPPRLKRFDVIYCLYSMRHRHRIRLKVRAGDGDPVVSVASVWPAANWLEREVYDMFGVNFVEHPDRRRILMPDEWQGHPQRKDYPLEGPGELLMEDPLDWLRLRNMHDEAEIE